MLAETKPEQELLQNYNELSTEELAAVMEAASTDHQTYSLFILHASRLILITAASAASAAISKQQHWQSNITEADAAKATSLGYFTLVVGAIIIVKLICCSEKKAGKFNSGLRPAALSGAKKGTLASLIGAAILKQDILACISVSAAGSALAFGAIGLFASGGKMAAVVDSQSKTGCGSSALRIVGS
jgi:hypothetical protein